MTNAIYLNLRTTHKPYKDDFIRCVRPTVEGYLETHLTSPEIIDFVEHRTHNATTNIDTGDWRSILSFCYEHDPYLNCIPLGLWDSFYNPFLNNICLGELISKHRIVGISVGDAVGLAKAAARQIIEEYKEEQEDASNS